MGRFTASFAVTGSLCVMLLLLAGSEGKLFYVLRDSKVCSMLDVSFNMTFTTYQWGKELRAISLGEDYYRNHVTGDCKESITLHFGNYADWNFTVHFQTVPGPEYLLTRTVSFLPYSLFGQTDLPNRRQSFVNPEDAVIGLPSTIWSYKCPFEDKCFYNKANSTSVGYTYSVFVDVKDIQIQVSHVRKEQFGKPMSCNPSLYYN